ncbi:MAG: hypothetical protein ACFBZ8_08280 [Opitutales bacterium]
MSPADSPPSPSEIPELYTDTHYALRRKVMTVLGNALTVHNSEERLVAYTRQKALKLREDIRIYADEAQQQPLLQIQARNIIDFSAMYDVVDVTTDQRIGALRRKGAKSLFRDEWSVLDINDRDIALIREDSMGKALLRRFATNLIPQAFLGTSPAGERLFSFKQHFNPLVLKMKLDFSPDENLVLDRRLGIAAAVLLALIEGRQD